MPAATPVQNGFRDIQVRIVAFDYDRKAQRNQLTWEHNGAHRHYRTKGPSLHLQPGQALTVVEHGERVVGLVDPGNGHFVITGLPPQLATQTRRMPTFIAAAIAVVCLIAWLFVQSLLLLLAAVCAGAAALWYSRDQGPASMAMQRLRFMEAFRDHVRGERQQPA